MMLMQSDMHGEKGNLFVKATDWCLAHTSVAVAFFKVGDYVSKHVLRGEYSRNVMSTGLLLNSSNFLSSTILI